MGSILNLFTKKNKSINTSKKSDTEKEIYFKKISQSTKWEIITPIETSKNVQTDFPLSELPSDILDAALETARFVKISVQAPAIVAISLVAVAIGKKAIIYERDGLKHFASLFFSIILSSGERKSGVFSVLFTVLIEWISSKDNEHKIKSKKAKINNQLVKKSLSAIHNKLKDDGSNIEKITKELIAAEESYTDIPPSPNLFTNDATEERLFQLMDEHDGCYAVMSSEGRKVFEALMGSHSKSESNGDAIYLAGISGDVITRDRVGGADGPEQRIITNPSLNVCVMVQPDLFNKALSNQSLNSSGAIARIWPIHPPSLVGQRIEAEDEKGLNTCHIENLNKTVKKLLDFPISENSTELHAVKLSLESSEARRIFSNKIETSMNENGDFSDAKDIASKAVTQTVKLALVLHLAKKPELIENQSSEIDIATWKSAEKLGEWFLYSALSFKNISKENALVHDICRILQWINLSWKRSGLTYRQLMQSGPSPKPKAEKNASLILSELERHGFLKLIPNESGTIKQYIINPICFGNITPYLPE